MNTTNKTLKRLVVLMTALIGLSAQAGVLVEPYLGIATMGDGKVKPSVSSTRTDLEYKFAPTAGFRAGYSMWGAMVGIDASYQKTELQLERRIGSNITDLGDQDVDKSQAGIFVGYNLPMPMRVWATYYLMGSVKFDDDSKYTSGNGYAFGASYTGLPLVALNFEYRNMEYSESETASGATSNTDVNLGELLFTVSMPFDLELF